MQWSRQWRVILATLLAASNVLALSTSQKGTTMMRNKAMAPIARSKQESDVTQIDHDKIEVSPRRAFFKTLCATAATVALTTASSSPAVAAAVPLFSRDRRQLELCLVSIWRVVYWADRLAADLGNPNINIESRKQSYLEARLAAKAMLTGKIGGGANFQVFTLSTLQIPDCLQDLSQEYDKSRSFGETSREFYESIASLVEFDGMDTLTDPSPRSSLTLTQYTTQKETFVRRILAERIVPLGKKLIYSFPEANVALSERYIQQNYSNEIFPQPVVTSE